MLNKDAFEKIYTSYNNHIYIKNDPVEYVFNYLDRDREIAALVASSLAYGRVQQIRKSVSGVLEKIDPPCQFLLDTSQRELEMLFRDFRHRFTTSAELVALLLGTKSVIKEFGSLKACFESAYRIHDSSYLPALKIFISLVLKNYGNKNSLLPLPDGGSAFKRACLFLRWMIRSDETDPGGWIGLPKSKLVYPLDTHIHRTGILLGLTLRKQNDERTALEITEGFRQINEDDPVKYDFALTHLCIRGEFISSEFLI